MSIHSQDDGSVPLTSVHTDVDHFEEMIGALKKGDADALSSAVVRLSGTDLDMCFPIPTNKIITIPSMYLPSAVKKDLSRRSTVLVCPVHYAAMKGDKECLEILLSVGANPNTKNSFGQTALHILSKAAAASPEKDFTSCLCLLLNHASISSKRLDLSKSTAEEHPWFQLTKVRVMSGSHRSPSLVRDAGTEIGDALLKDLLDQNIEGFRNTLNGIRLSPAEIGSILDESHGSYTLLQYATRSGLIDFVDELLIHGASPVREAEMNILPPVMWAAKFGYHMILEQLINNMTEKHMQGGALQVCTETMETPLHMAVMCGHPEQDDGVDYHRCLLILLDKKDFIDLDATNDDDNTALHFASLCTDVRAFTALLRNGADFTRKNVAGLSALQNVKKEDMVVILNNCIDFNTNEKMIDTNFWISLDYGMMDSSRFTSQASSKCGRLSEMNFISLVSEFFQDRDVLYHPLLQIFTQIKWHNIRKYFYLNFAINFVFLSLLIAYIGMYHSSFKKAKNSEIDESIIYFELPDPAPTTEADQNSRKDDTDYVVHRVLLSFLLTFLVLWQNIQLFMLRSWKEYLFDVRKYVEVITLVLTFVLLIPPFGPRIKMGIAAWLVLFASLQFILQLGQLPQFAVYVEMFNKVAWNFFFFICLFSGIILSFSFSFFLMLQSANGMFTTYAESLLKTIVMTTGELEFSSLMIAESTFPAASQVLIVLFVFMVLLVLMNLLNGLAISDIQHIQRRAEVISYQSLIYRMLQLEAAFYSTNTRNPFKKVLDILFSFTLTFKHCLPKHSLTIYVSRKPVEYSSDGMKRKTICNCHSYALPDNIIERLKQIVLDKRTPHIS